jgi:hypothetical protein
MEWGLNKHALLGKSNPKLLIKAGVSFHPNASLPPLPLAWRPVLRTPRNIKAHPEVQEHQNGVGVEQA